MSTENELPEGWVSAPLGSFTDIFGGSTPSRKENRYFGGDIVWLTPTEIPKETVSIISDSKEKLTEEGFKESGVRWIPTGSVLLTSRASIGYVAIAGVKLTTNQGFASLVLPKEIDPKYLGWWLRSQKATLEDLAKGTTFREISKATLKDVIAPIAPLAEQHRIVEVIEQQLSRLDAAVASLVHARKKLKRERVAILKAAVEGTLTADWRAEHPATESAAQLLERILKERCAKWEADQLEKMHTRGITPKDDKWKNTYKEPELPDTTNLPGLPEKWIWASLDQCSRRITDGTHQPPPFTGKGIPFIFVAHIVKGSISFENTKFISESTYAQLNARCPVEYGDILYSAVGSYGVAVPVLTHQPFSFQRHIAHIKPSFLLSMNYLLLCLNSSCCLDQAHKVARGVAQKTVTLTDLAHFAIPLPPLSEQEQIVSEVEQHLSIIAQSEAAVEENLKRAERLHQSILREAFTGRLVPQSPNDEPASVLLERIREERTKCEQKEQQRRKVASMNQLQSAKTKKTAAKERLPLHQVLVEAGKPLAPDDLFRRAGLQAESVDEFYEELREEVQNGRIKELIQDTTQVLLEAV